MTKEERVKRDAFRRIRSILGSSWAANQATLTVSNRVRMHPDRGFSKLQVVSCPTGELIRLTRTFDLRDNGIRVPTTTDDYDLMRLEEACRTAKAHFEALVESEASCS